MSQEKITMLTDREHALQKPAMYIGSVTLEEHERFVFGEYKTIQYVPGLIKIISELIDNSIDEAIRTNFEYANKISVSINAEKVIVKDNGRGIPQDEVITPEGTSLPGPVAAWTRTKAGSNFGNDATRKTIGTNGVGSSLANIFSKEFVGQTSDGKNLITVSCSDNMGKVEWKTSKSTASKRGTIVEITPDLKRFGIDKIGQNEIDLIKDQLQTIAVIYPKIKIEINGETLQGNFKKYVSQFEEDPIIMESDAFSLALCRSPDGFRHISFANGVHTKNGGNHVECIFDELVSELTKSIQRKYKIEINKARIKECITMILFVRDMVNMRFDSQTKERLTSPMGEVKSHLQLNAKKLAQQFMKNETVLMPIIESVLARKLAADKAAATKANNEAKKAKVAKHIKANLYGNDTVETTLFLTEGDSAIGYLIATRDQELHGGYPLRGKVLNTWGKTASQMMSNKELFDICAITGLKVGEKAENLNYKNLAIFVDADQDGLGSIYPSLLAFFSNWPELFEQGRIKLCKSPIIIAEKGKDKKFYYSLNDFENDRDTLQGYKTKYIKGLGTLSEDDYAKVVNDPVYEVIKLPDDYKEQFELLFGKDADARKEWMSS